MSKPNRSINRLKVTQNQGGFVLGGIVNMVFGIIISLLALRFVFMLFGANAGNSFVNLIYGLSQPLVNPFYGLFNMQPQLESQTANLEIATLIALLIYGLIAGILTRVTTARGHHAR